LKLLLDTHIALWVVAAPERLSSKAIALIEGGEPFVSAVSILEAAIKFHLRRGTADDMPMSGGQLLTEAEAAGIPLLSISPDHAAAVDALPLHHRDPFDRLLVAQAVSEPMYLLTQDAALAAYGDHVLIV
jgi:PIN domain nuclease of toxin-antitoxin system